MKIVERRYFDEEDCTEFFVLEVDGKRHVHVGRIEPEDATVGRDLNFVWSISNLMKLAYEAGKAGEEFEIKEVEGPIDE
jgi:hypothetical protein